MNATKRQTMLIHNLLAGKALLDCKKEIISHFSNGRTETSKELTMQEASKLINSYTTKTETETPKPKVYDSLNESKKIQFEARKRMRNKLLSMAYRLGWATGGDWDTANMALEGFAQSKKGKFGKPLDEHSNDELRQLVSQIEHLVVKEGK